MAATERVAEGAFTGASEVTIGTWTAGVSTLLSLHGKNDQASDRTLLVRHKKASTYTDLEQQVVLAGASFFIGVPVGAIDAADESIVATLNGAGTFQWQAVWLDRT